MGAWGNGPFDNDSAADFACVLNELSTPQEREKVIVETLRSYLANAEEGWLGFWEPLAAAAFVADRYNRSSQFTSSVYAMVEDEEGELQPPKEIPEPSPQVLALAHQAMTIMLRHSLNVEHMTPWQGAFLEVQDAITGHQEDH